MKKLIARKLLEIKAVFLRPDEPFTWASGIKSPIYCDNRLTLTAPAVRTLDPNRLSASHRKDAPGRLTDAALAVPCKFRAGKIHPHRLFQMFRSQSDRLHLTPLIQFFISWAARS